MSIIAGQKRELEHIEAAKYITRALRDISANKMRGIRESFARNYAFYTDIRQLYTLVRSHAARAKTEAKEKGEGAAEEKGIRRTASISVAITSNKRFYGSLNKKVMDAFIKQLDRRRGRHIVIGKTGRQYLAGTKYERRAEYLSFEADNPNEDELGRFLDAVRSHDRILVYYPRFINVFRQDVAIVDIAEVPEEETVAETKVGYIFEPELTHMLLFFETQVQHLLFSRIMLEAELARTAARLMKMDSAEREADAEMKRKRRILHKEMTALSNMHLLETFSGFQQWKKK